VKVPFIIHVFNLFVLLALSVILLLTTVVRPYQFVVLTPLIVSIILYFKFRTNQKILALSFGLSISLALWIILCENIVTIDKLFGTRITRRLSLGQKLYDFVHIILKDESKHHFQQCCNDPLSYSFKPGSESRLIYDCDICGNPYQVVADEIGYLNQQQGLFNSSDQIDLFLAGDSVTQGYGVPSVLEFVREQIHVKMWNLSIMGYGPRQKINALITHALQKHPKWLIVEFFSGNDIPDSIDDEIRDSSHSFQRRLSAAHARRQLLASPIYGSLLDTSGTIFEQFGYYCENNFTLAVTRYLIDNAKLLIKSLFSTRKYQGSSLTESSKISYNFKDFAVTYPANPSFQIRPGKLAEWTRAGLKVTHKHYERLITELATSNPRPKVILLYNPSSYEIYRDILLDRRLESDRAAEIQLQLQRDFAEKYGWVFLDLTDPLRRELKKNKVWLYGRYDGTHWSLEGTAFVAAVLTEELRKVIVAEGAL
jgi:hypothetical protein